MTTEFRHDHARVNGECPDALWRQPSVQFDTEENVGSFALPVGLPLVIVTLFVVGVFEVKAREAMTRRTEIDDASRRVQLEGWNEKAGQKEVSNVIGRQLRLVSSRGSLKRAGHEPCVVDQKVQGLFRSDPSLRARANALKIGQLKRGHADLVVARGGSNFCSDTLGLFEIPSGEGDRCACARQDACGFRTQSAGGAGHKGIAPAEIDPLDRFLGGRFSAIVGSHLAAS